MNSGVIGEEEVKAVEVVEGVMDVVGVAVDEG